ncbi:Fe-S cluster assembly protein HesB, partial [Rhodococcus rhodochrous]
MKLCLAQKPEADALLEASPFALLMGMLLDQQVPMETAFAGPKKFADRLGGLDVHRIADADPDEFAAICARPPAVHRFPGSMAKRIQALCAEVTDRY